ncbi:MAG TPA: hypothetical protein VGE72_02270 [Azospirillum sp.]
MAFAGLLLFVTAPAGAVGFQWDVAPDPDDQPIQVAIWYPSDAPAKSMRLGANRQTVADGGAVSGTALALVVLSHGTGGWAGGTHDTALALAEAGFVVASLTHTGDNHKDKAYAFTQRTFTDRPRHVSRTIDHMLGGWSGRASIDPARIGVFGYSAGGYTALVVAGGKADLGRMAAFCRSWPDDWGCQRGAEKQAAGTPPMDAVVQGRDARIRAAVLAAPALGTAFAPSGLAEVTLPVQLWRGARDQIVTDADLVRQGLPNAPEDHLVPNADHFAFLPPCSRLLAVSAPEICQDPEGFDRSAFHAEFNRAVVGFFGRHLGK